MNKPSIGRIVHYTCQFTGEHLAAIIVRVWSDTCVNLRIFYDGTNHGQVHPNEWVTSVKYDESVNPQNQTWHWPERV